MFSPEIFQNFSEFLKMSYGDIDQTHEGLGFTRYGQPILDNWVSQGPNLFVNSEANGIYVHAARNIETGESVVMLRGTAVLQNAAADLALAENVQFLKQIDMLAVEVYDRIILAELR